MPDLAVEVVSPSDVAGILDEKVEAHLHAGVRRVSIVSPVRGCVEDAFVHYGHRAIMAIAAPRIGDSLEGRHVLPEISLTLADLFEVGLVDEDEDRDDVEV